MHAVSSKVEYGMQHMGTVSAHTHTHCAEYIPYPMSPGGCPLTCGAAAVGGAMYSCLLPAPDTPAHREEAVTHQSVSVQGML